MSFPNTTKFLLFQNSQYLKVKHFLAQPNLAYNSTMLPGFLPGRKSICLTKNDEMPLGT